MTKHKETLFWFNSQKYLLLLGLFIVVSLPLLKISTVLFSLNSDWYHGFAHPLQGWDHILTMLAVGIWAAQLRGQAIWLLPATFVSVMSFGGLVGVASLVISSVEIMILLSGLVFSAFIVRKVKFTTQLNVLIVA
ncbi:MAG: HupE/UreJ family protein, partial [Methylococcaceae bacterium]